ncbi:MAG: FecR family protein [Tannerellaceae bacterium]|nr:FecR family protein [Tannerellaceae bacterium]
MNTDLAWHRLHTRLQQDRLIPDATEISPGRLFNVSSLRLAAAIVIAISVATVTLMLRQKTASEQDGSLLALYNEKGYATLVTALEDGSVVYLADDSRLYYPEHFPTAGKRDVSLEGRAMFDVRGDSRRPFIITTPTVQIEVTGTVFDLQSAGSNPFELSVRQGQVKITSTKSGQHLYAQAGETVTLTPSGNLLAEETAGNNPFSIYDGRIRFKDEKLINILRIINNNKASELTLQTTPSLENRTITATFIDATPENVAELICIALNLLCKKDNNTLLITEP